MPGSRSTPSAAAIRRGTLSLAFFDAAAYERFAALADETFRQVSDRTGIPLELLMVVREAIGMAPPSPDDRLRDDEMAIVPFLELQLAEGFRPAAIERLLRVQGDSTRRMTEQEGAWWHSEVIEPALAAGKARTTSGTPSSPTGCHRSRSRASWPCTTRTRRAPGPATSSTRSR